MDTLELVRLAKQGRLSARVLASLLAPNPRDAFLAACAWIEGDFANRHVAGGDVWLDEDETPDEEAGLETLRASGIDYQKACTQVWLPIFTDPRNRADEWSN